MCWTWCLLQHLNQHCLSSYLIIKNTKIEVYITIILSVFCVGGWRRSHGVEFHYSYSLPNIIRVMESRNNRYILHAICMSRWEMHTRFWLESLRKEMSYRTKKQKGVWHSSGSLRRWERIDWIDLLLDTDSWQAVLSMVMNL